MTHYPFWPATIAALFVVYAWVRARLQRNVQPLRLELADLGEAVIACPDTSDRGRRVVRSYLDTAFSSRGFLFLAVFVVPVIAAVKTYRIIQKGKAATRLGNRENNPQVHAMIDEITDLHIRITLANHPLLCTLVILETAFCFALGNLVVAVISGIIPARVTPEEIAEGVDYAYARIPSRLRGSHGIAHSCF